MLTNQFDAYAHLQVYVYADHYPDSRYAGQGQLNKSYTFYTAPGQPVVAMLSLGGSDAGIAVGLRCNRLHIDPRLALAVSVRTASPAGLFGAAGPHLPESPIGRWNNGWAGLVLYWQAGWYDSTTKAASLTNATRLVLPRKPGGPRPSEACRYVYRYTHGSNPPSGPVTGANSVQNPIEGWNKK